MQEVVGNIFGHAVVMPSPDTRTAHTAAGTAPAAAHTPCTEVVEGKQELDDRVDKAIVCTKLRRRRRRRV